jgi:hypothetical protein
LITHLVDSDVIDSCLTSRKEHGGQEKQSRVSKYGKFIWCKYLNICYVVAGIGSISAYSAISNTEIHGTRFLSSKETLY